MEYLHILSWGIPVLLIFISYILLQRDEKKYKEALEDEMKKWIMQEFAPAFSSADRRGSNRSGGRRATDKIS